MGKRTWRAEFVENTWNINLTIATTLAALQTVIYIRAAYPLTITPPHAGSCPARYPSPTADLQNIQVQRLRNNLTIHSAAGPGEAVALAYLSGSAGWPFAMISWRWKGIECVSGSFSAALALIKMCRRVG